MFRKPPAVVVSELIAAVSDGRIGNLLLLVDPGVVCFPATGPGLVVYEGCAGMMRLVADLSVAYGPHRIEVGNITQETGTMVTALTRIVPVSGGQNHVAGRVRSVYTFRSGLVTFIESDPVRPRTEPGSVNAELPRPPLPA